MSLRERSPAERGRNNCSQHFIRSIISDSCVNIYQNGGRVWKMASSSQNVIKLRWNYFSCTFQQWSCGGAGRMSTLSAAWPCYSATPPRKTSVKGRGNVSERDFLNLGQRVKGWRGHLWAAEAGGAARRRVMEINGKGGGGSPCSWWGDQPASAAVSDRAWRGVGTPIWSSQLSVGGSCVPLHQWCSACDDTPTTGRLLIPGEGAQYLNMRLSRLFCDCFLVFCHKRLQMQIFLLLNSISGRTSPWSCGDNQPLATTAEDTPEDIGGTLTVSHWAKIKS